MSEVATAPAQTTPASPAAAAAFVGGDPKPAESTSPPSSSLFSQDLLENGRFKEGWSERLQEKYPTAAGKLGQAKDEDGVWKTIDHAIRLASARELKGSPNDTWTEIEKADYREKFGVPPTPDQYKFKPDKLETGVHWPEQADQLTQRLHEKGVPGDVVEMLGQEFHGFLKGQTDHAVSKFDERISTLASESEQRFRKEWGADYDGKLSALNNYVASQFTPEERKDPIVKAALSHPKIVAILDREHSSIREGPLPNGQPMPSGSLSPRQQARELAKTKEYQAGDQATVKRVMDLYAQDAAQKQRANNRS